MPLKRPRTALPPTGQNTPALPSVQEGSPEGLQQPGFILQLSAVGFVTFVHKSSAHKRLVLQGGLYSMGRTHH